MLSSRRLIQQGAAFALGHASTREGRQLLVATTTSRRMMGHTVRVICVQDLPNGKAYQGDVVHVKAGYARNYLIPKKKVLYATRQNFERLQMKDPDLETADERRARLASKEDDQDLKAADLLRHYLRNKVLKIWRNVDPTTSAVSPGLVDAKAVRQKLSKQLKIDLEAPDETIHLRPEPILEWNQPQFIETALSELHNRQEPCQVQIRQLGDYLACISLKGGHAVPLKVEVLKR